MKKVKLLTSLLALLSIFWPLWAIQASVYNWPPVKSAADFVKLGDGQCVYYQGGGCPYGQWFTSPRDYCNWEPCCRYKANADQPDGWDEFMFKKDCGATSAKETVETDKNKCLKQNGFDNLDCCCAEDKGQVTKVAAGNPPQFIMPEFQIPIPTVELTDSTSICTASADGSYHCAFPWIGEYIVGIYNYGFGVAGILATIVLMAGGLIWLVSGGDASKITQAKELITGSVIGLIILAGSYVLLAQINPRLTFFKPISLDPIKAKELGLAVSRNNVTSQDYRDASCASDEELKNGVNFYATGYYKPAWANTDEFRCVVAMQCSCPNGVDTTKNCDALYGKTFPNYRPCKYFPIETPYCNMTASGVAPQDGMIAGPKNCSNLPHGTQVCFKGKTYTITDSGGGIKGRRIDIWSGSDLKKAYANTGVGKLTIGACK